MKPGADEPDNADEVVIELTETPPKKRLSKKTPSDPAAPRPSVVDLAKPQRKAKAKAKADPKTSIKAKGADTQYLPKGWRRVLRVRKSGKSQGLTDMYYYDPNGKCYDSYAKASKAFS